MWPFRGRILAPRRGILFATHGIAVGTPPQSHLAL